jgi:hypothetical protein
LNTIRYYATLTITRLYFLGALAASYVEIRHGFERLGTTNWKAQMAPITIDLFAVLGAIARSKAFTDRTRRIGFRVQAVASSVSFIANVAFGESWGDRIFGALIVAGYVFSEWFADNMEKRTTDEPAAPAVVEVVKEIYVEVPATVDPMQAKREAANAKRRFNAAVKREVERIVAARTATAELELAEMAAGYVPADAPVSPAPIGENASYL